jgi:hypothetical protein
MNEQVQKLLDKATDDIMGVPIVNQELFARLIVEECANICYELRFTTEGPSDNASYQRTLCGSAIKENFGLVSKGPITAKNMK